MIRILLADDHRLVREGLKQLLAEAPELTVVAEAASGEEVLERVPAGGIDLVILDISLPGRSGLEVLKQLRETAPGLPVLVLSMYPEEQYAVRVIRSGASGYLTKDAAPEELVEAIRRIADGQKFISADLADLLASFLEESGEKPRHERLSDREFEVLRLLAAGLPNKEIAGRLSLSPKTISTYRSRILDKLGLHSGADLVRYAVDRGLVD